MPKRLVAIAPEQLAWQPYDEPALDADQVRIKAEFAAAKHGTEMAFYKGYALARGPYDREYQLHRKSETPWLPYPFAVGNMIVGRVIEKGAGVKKVKEGDRVCVFSGFRPTCVAKEGACWVMPEGMSWKSAVCLDPADFAFAAVRDGHVRIGAAVAVSGMGAIGLMVVQLARLAGARQVIAIDPLPGRRAIAEQLGATATLDPRACDVGLTLKEMTAKRGVDVAIEYSGAAPAVQHALRGVAYGGNVVLGAFPGAFGPGLDLGAEAHMNIPNIMFTRACSQPDRDHPRWDEPRVLAACWDLLVSGKISGELIVQPVVPFESLLEEYPKIASQPQDFLKLGATF